MLVSLFKDPLALTVRHCALFILIRPDMGRDLSRGKITASHLEEEMNTEFEMSVVSNFFSLNKQPCQISKARQTIFADNFFVLGRSIRLRLQYNNAEDAGKLFLLSPNV